MTYLPTVTNPADYKTLVDSKFEEWAALLAVTGGRMQTDADLFNLVKKTTHIKDVNGDEIANSLYIVLSDPATFAWKVESALNSAVEQVVVTAENKRFDTAYVENFIQAAYKGADKLLSLRGHYPLNSFLDQQNFRRGSEAARFWFRIEDGELVTDIQPWDTGYLVVRHDSKGISLTGYKTFRSWSDIISEHPEADLKDYGWDIRTQRGNDIEVLYIMGRDKAELWVAGHEVKTRQNKLGYVPVVYRRVPMGSMLLDRNSIKYEGESGLFLIRDLIPELNRLVSIIQSLNLQELDHALQEKKDREDFTPKGHEIPTTDELTRPGTLVETTGGFTPMPIGEVRAQAELLHKMIQDRVDRVMTNFQNFPQPRTATEILALTQEQDIIAMPRLANRGLLKQDGAEMFIKQTIAEAEKWGLSDVKMNGKSYQVSKLKGEYTIEYQYSYRDARVDAARQSVAVGWRGMRPDSWILRNVVMSEDPDEEERNLAMEKARQESPLIDLDWKITKLLEAADDGDPYAEGQAIQLAMQWIPMARQAMQGLIAPVAKAEVQPSKASVPLLPAGTAGGVQGG